MKERRNVSFTMRFSESEYKMLKVKAKHRKRPSLSSYLRWLMIHDDERLRVFDEERMD